MNKAKILLFSIVLITVYGNIAISNNKSDGISFSLSQLIANAQGNPEVINPITGQPEEGAWFPGSQMVEVMVNTTGYTQTTNTYTCGIQASSHNNVISGHASCTLATTTHQNFKNIMCCRTANANTACNTSGQNPEC